MMTATTGMSSYTFTVITERLKDRLREMGIDPAQREATRKADEKGKAIARKAELDVVQLDDNVPAGTGAVVIEVKQNV